MTALARSVTVFGITYPAGTDHSTMPVEHVDRIRNPDAWDGGVAPERSSDADGHRPLRLYALNTAAKLRAALGLSPTPALTGDVETVRRVVRAFTSDPGVAGLDRIDLNFTVTTNSSDTERLYVNGVMASWRNEVGFLRGTPHAGYRDDALVRGIPRNDLTNQNGGFIELENAGRTQVLYKRDWRTGSLWRGNGSAAAVKMADVLVLSGATSVPAGTPAGTVVVRTA